MPLETNVNLGLLTRIGTEIKKSLTSRVLAYSLAGTLAFGGLYSLKGCGGEEKNQPTTITATVYIHNGDNIIYEAFLDGSSIGSIGKPSTSYSCSENKFSTKDTFEARSSVNHKIDIRSNGKIYDTYSFDVNSYGDKEIYRYLYICRGTINVGSDRYIFMDCADELEKRNCW